METSFQSLSLGDLKWFWIGLSAFVTIIYFTLRRDSRVDKYLRNFDGPPTLPLLGNVFELFLPNDELIPKIISWYWQYGPAFRVWLGNMPYVVLSGSREVEKILSTTTHIEKSSDYDLLHKWLGQGLLTAKPQKWHGRRKLLTPAFHFNILEEFNPIFNEQGNIFVKTLKKQQSNGKSFDIFPYVTRCALDIICETAMGLKLHAQKGEEPEYVKAVYRYGDMLVKKFLQPWLQVGLIAKILGYEHLENKYLQVVHDFTGRVISERKKERRQLKTSKDTESAETFTKKRRAFLDLLLDVAETDSTLTDTDIREEVDTFMFEGHDTTAANFAWTIFLMSLYPEQQKRVQDELKEIFGENTNRNITAADVSKMKYLECCVKESLRLFPSVPVYFRRLSEDVDLGNTRIIPKGITVLILALCLHKDPEVFPDPESFNPERFYSENVTGSGRSPYAYVPFSAGPRNCIGQKFALLEEKIVLAKFFMNFNVEGVTTRETVKMVPDVILRPYGGIHVKLTPRT